MDAPETASVGETIDIKETGHQAGNVNFPCDTQQASIGVGSENVIIGTGEALEKAKESNEYNVVFDSATEAHCHRKRRDSSNC